MAAVGEDMDPDVFSRFQVLKRLDAYKRIVSRGDDQGGHRYFRNDGQSGSSSIVIEGVGKSSPGRRVQLIEDTHGQPTGKAHPGQIGEVLLLLRNLLDEGASIVMVVKAVPGLLE